MSASSAISHELPLNGLMHANGEDHDDEDEDDVDLVNYITVLCLMPNWY